MKRVAIYVRVSTQEQAAEGHYSISEQLERLRKYCEAHGWVLVKEYVDPGFSGTNTNRPALQNLLRDIPFGGFDTVLVYKLDRLSRSQKDTMQLIEDVFMAHNIDFISMNENFDTSTPFGRAMIGILSVFAQLERDQIKERLAMGRIGRAKSGKWNGGQKPPVGYDYKDGQLTILEYEAMQIRLIFDLFINGLNGEQLSMHQIKNYMGEHYRTRYSAWAQAACVSRVLKNRVYIGEIKYAGIWYPGDHEPIIDMETWEAAQLKYETYIKQFSKSQRQPFQGRNLLSGMLYCGDCGARYYMSESTRVRKTTGKKVKYYHYRCYSKSGMKKMIKSNNCQSKGFQRDVLNQMVIDEIKKLALNPEAISSLQGMSLPKIEDNSEVIKNRITEIEKQIDKLIDLYQVGGIAVAKLSERVDKLNEEKDELLSELEEEKPPLLMPAEEVQNIIMDCDSVFENGTPEEQQALVRALINKIVINGEDLEIHWSFCAESL